MFRIYIYIYIYMLDTCSRAGRYFLISPIIFCYSCLHILDLNVIDSIFWVRRQHVKLVCNSSYLRIKIGQYCCGISKLELDFQGLGKQKENNYSSLKLSMIYFFNFSLEPIPCIPSVFSGHTFISCPARQSIRGV